VSGVMHFATLTDVLAYLICGLKGANIVSYRIVQCHLPDFTSKYCIGSCRFHCHGVEG